MDFRPQVPRLLPDEPFPPYSYVTGRFPHPLRDPAGHSFGQHAQRASPIDESCWRESRAYLRAIDLFNYGYYWEAHEAWESLWHAAGRQGTAADFLKGLIKLAAAGVKAREGRQQGISRLARRALELFQAVAAQLAPGRPTYLGLDCNQLLAFSGRLAEQPAIAPPNDGPVQIVFDFALAPK